MGCKHLDCDIIVASEVSDFINFLNAFTHKDVREDVLKKHSFNVERCLRKQEASRFYGMGNVFAESSKEDYVRFISKSKALVYIGNGIFKVNPVNISCNSLGFLDKILAIKDIFKYSYSTDTLKALDII